MCNHSSLFSYTQILILFIQGLMQSLVEIGPLILEKMLKMRNFIASHTDTIRQNLIKRVYLSLQLRWSKNNKSQITKCLPNPFISIRDRVTTEGISTSRNTVSRFSRVRQRVKYCIKWVSRTASVQARNRPVQGFSGDIPRLPHPTPPPIPEDKYCKTFSMRIKLWKVYRQQETSAKFPSGQPKIITHSKGD